MSVFALPIPSVHRHSSSTTRDFDRAYRTFEAQQYVWVAAMLDRSLLERCVLRDGILQPRAIADRRFRALLPQHSEVSSGRDSFPSNRSIRTTRGYQQQGFDRWEFEMSVFTLPLPSVHRHSSRPTCHFDRAYRTFEAQQYVWVAAMLDRSLLERCVLRDGILQPRAIADRWAAEICPCSDNPTLKQEAERAATLFLQLYAG